MTIRRSLAPLAFAIAPLLLVHCTSETPGQDSGGGGSPSAGAGNPTGGVSGSAGSAAGSVATGGVAGTGASTGGSAGSGAVGGTSGASSGGSGGSSGGAGTSGMGAAGAGGSGGGPGGASGASPGGAGAGGGASGAGAGGTGGGGFVLTSSKIVPDMELSSDFTCAGDSHSPPLAWSGAPAGTMSFAIVFVDTTIINANMTDQRGYHSAIWDIPATTMALPENLPVGASITTPVVAKQFNPLRAAYLGPCPNNGTAPADTYEFRLFALPVATLTGTLTSVRSILQAIQAANPLGTAVLGARSDATGTLK